MALAGRRRRPLGDMAKPCVAVIGVGASTLADKLEVDGMGWMGEGPARVGEMGWAVAGEWTGRWRWEVI